MSKIIFLFTISKILFKRSSNNASSLHSWLIMKAFESFCESVKTRMWLHTLEAMLWYPKKPYICWRIETTGVLIHCVTLFTLSIMWMRREKIISCISKVLLFWKDMENNSDVSHVLTFSVACPVNMQGRLSIWISEKKKLNKSILLEEFNEPLLYTTL